MFQSALERPVFGRPDVSLKIDHRNGGRLIDRHASGTHLSYQTHPPPKVKVAEKK
jgi:hypothetical protein